MATRVVLAAVFWSASASAAPALPSRLSPAAGGWTPRNFELQAIYAGGIPPDIAAGEFEVEAPAGTHFATLYSGRRDGDHLEVNCPDLPDAGSYAWRFRAFDDAGSASAWAGPEAFRLDDVAPTAPASLTALADGGEVTLVAAPATDSQSGVSRYSIYPGVVDPPGAGPSLPPLGLDLTGVSPTATLLLGPGRWVPIAVAVDAVNNAGPPAFTAITVTENAGLAPPTPLYFSLSGTTVPGPWLPYLYDSSPTLTWAAPADYDAGGYSVIASRPDAGVWFFVAQSRGTSHVLSLGGEGPWQVRVAALSGDQVSPWSAPAFVWADRTAPFPVALAADVDGGIVWLSWAAGVDRDATTTGSGIRRYDVSRCCAADAGTLLATRLHQPDASYSVSDTPGDGAFSYQVSIIDLAGNTAVSAVTVRVADGGAVVLDAGPLPEAQPADAGPAAGPLSVGCGCRSTFPSLAAALGPMGLIRRRRLRSPNGLRSAPAR